MTLITLRNLGVSLGAPLFSQSQPRRQCRRPDRTRRRQRPRQVHPAPLHRRARWSRAKATSPDPRGLTVGYVEQNVPDALMDRTVPCGRARGALRRPSRPSESWRVDVVLEQLEVPEALRETPLKQLSGGWQRLAMLARVLGDGAGRAAAGRADQPSRPRPDRPAGGLAERAAARDAGRHRQPRPRLSRCDHQPDAVPAPGAVAGVFAALYAGARGAATRPTQPTSGATSAT